MRAGGGIRGDVVRLRDKRTFEPEAGGPDFISNTGTLAGALIDIGVSGEWAERYNLEGEGCTAGGVEGLVKVIGHNGLGLDLFRDHRSDDPSKRLSGLSATGFSLLGMLFSFAVGSFLSGH